MVKPTPTRFNPDLLARDSTPYSVNLPLAQFSRLREMLLDDSGEMHATFRFSRRKQSVLVSGTLKATYRLQCQRCLEPMEHVVDEQFQLVFAKTAEIAEDMPDSLDPVVLDDHGQIHVVDLFEDEMILYLPNSAMHTQIEECNANELLLKADELGNQSLFKPEEREQSEQESEEQKNEQGENEQTGTAGKRKNPFDVLKNLDLH